MKISVFIFLLSICSALAHAADDDCTLKKKDQNRAIEKFEEEIYGHAMQKQEDDRCKKMTRENMNFCISCYAVMAGLNHRIEFCTLLDNDGKTTRGKIANCDPMEHIINITNKFYSIPIEDQIRFSPKKKNGAHKKTFYKKTDLFELRENRHYPFEERTKTITFRNLAKITSCMLMALKSENSISFSETGPYEIILTHNLPDECIEREPFFDADSKTKSLRRFDLFIGYLNSIGNHIITSPNAHVTFNATLPTTLEELVLSGILSDYTLNNAPQNLKLSVTGRHNIFDTNKQKFNNEIKFSGNGNRILFDPSKSNVKVDPKCQIFSLKS